MFPAFVMRHLSVLHTNGIGPGFPSYNHVLNVRVFASLDRFVLNLSYEWTLSTWF
jgi:hypothetical protein